MTYDLGTEELISKAREAMLCAVQIFNNPLVSFKSELFIVNSCISWTYLLQAYYKKHNIDFRYSEERNGKKEFAKTKYGSYRYWDLSRCLKVIQCPLDCYTKKNIEFLLKIRHEIEHQMTKNIDHSFTAKFQACCLNFNKYAKELFGDKHGIDKLLPISLQFSCFDIDQVNSLKKEEELLKNIKTAITEFESNMGESEYNNPSYAYRVIFVRKLCNKKTNTDKAIQFVNEGVKGTPKGKIYIKETEKKKYLPSYIVADMKKINPAFTMHTHTKLWKEKNAKDKSKGYGILIGKTWYWYESWYNIVRTHCMQSIEKPQKKPVVVNKNLEDVQPPM